MSAVLSPLNHFSNNYLRPLLSNVVDCTHYPLRSLQVHRQMSMVKTALPKLSSPRVSPNGELHLSVDKGEASDSEEYNQSKDSILSKKNILNNVNGVLGSSDSLEILSKKERTRRRKIGLANKGRVPWNKGRKHNAETRARIRQRTLEALRDPKVKS